MTTLIIDTETTGRTGSQPIELALLDIGPPPELNLLGSFKSRYRPTCVIEYGAMATHHITEAELANEPSFETFEFPPDCEYLVGHNVDFDWEVIGKPPVRRICTLALACARWPTLDSHTQGALLYFIDPENARRLLRGAHAAYDDTKICLAILKHLVTTSPESITSWEQLWRLSEAARIPKVLTFGKHKGLAYADAPRPYLKWIVDKSDLDVYVKQAAKAAL